MILFLTVLLLHQYWHCHHHVICCLYAAYHPMFKHVFTIEIKCDMGLTTNNSHKNNPRNQIQDRLPYSPQQAKTHISWQTVDGPSNNALLGKYSSSTTISFSNWLIWIKWCITTENYGLFFIYIFPFFLGFLYHSFRWILLVEGCMVTCLVFNSEDYSCVICWLLNPYLILFKL
jgi:hypothetical protein